MKGVEGEAHESVRPQRNQNTGNRGRGNGRGRGRGRGNGRGGGGSRADSRADGAAGDNAENTNVRRRNTSMFLRSSNKLSLF